MRLDIGGSAQAEWIVSFRLRSTAAQILPDPSALGRRMPEVSPRSCFVFL
jgi:hypothetical protein